MPPSPNGWRLRCLRSGRFRRLTGGDDGHSVGPLCAGIWLTHPNLEEVHAIKQGTLLAIVLAAIVLTVHSSHAQDQVGAPKNLTPQIVKNAVGLVQEGKRYSLAR